MCRKTVPIASAVVYMGMRLPCNTRRASPTETSPMMLAITVLSLPLLSSTIACATPTGLTSACGTSSGRTISTFSSCNRVFTHSA